MKKSLLICFLVVALSGLVLAQDETPRLLFEADATFTVQDLDFTFLYPEDWVYDTSDGILIAENEADLAAELDEDPATNAEGFTLKLIAVPVAALDLEEDSALPDMVDRMAEGAELEVQERFGLAVMTYHGVVVAGTDADGGQGVAVFWRQTDYLVMFGLGLPDAVELTGDVYYTFGYLLGAMSPLIDVELTETLMIDLFGGVTLNYPEGWLAGGGASSDGVTGSYYVVEVASDAATANAADVYPAGKVFMLQTYPRAELPFADTWAVYQFLLQVDMYGEMTQISEHLLFDDILTISMHTEVISETPTIPFLIFAGVTQDTVYLFGAKAPSPAALDEFRPLVLAMLDSITAVEEEA